MTKEIDSLVRLPMDRVRDASVLSGRRHASMLAWLSWILCCLAASTAFADARFPWAFDMTTDEVKDIKEFVPYKTFQNGDLETFNGLYDGEKENFQFFFRDGKLWRIGIYFYEGNDISAGGEAWLQLYQSLRKRFGPIETRGNIAPLETDPKSHDAFARNASDIVRSTGKTQMAPLRQPGDAFVFASFQRHVLAADTNYVVTLYLNRDRD